MFCKNIFEANFVKRKKSLFCSTSCSYRHKHGPITKGDIKKQKTLNPNKRSDFPEKCREAYTKYVEERRKFSPPINYKKVCLTCNSEYDTKSKKSKFCCSLCVRRLNKDGTIAKSVLEKTCFVCKKEFIAKTRIAMTCSKSCQDIKQNETRKKIRDLKNIPKTIEKNCEMCNSVFSVRNRIPEKKIRFCSKTCSTKIARIIGLSPENLKKRGKSLSNGYKSGRLKSKPKGGGSFYGVNIKKGNYFSDKNNKNLHYRSGWELIAYKYLDANLLVKNYQVEPFGILYHIDDEQHQYYPDILITNIDGSRMLIEIKPKRFLKSKINKQKFISAKKYCLENNIKFKVWTEKKIFEFKKTIKDL